MRPGPLLILVAIILGILAYTYPGILTHPGKLMPSTGGDGVKNEFSYLYQILYGKGVWFEGMNYPFGEHIIYTDGQPFLSLPLSALHKIIPFSGETAMAIMLYCIVLSYILGGIYIYRILIQLGANAKTAIPFAICILLLSPQVFRITGHFGLAYMSVIPMQLYWLLNYNESGKRKYALFIFLLTIIAALLHLYFLAMSLLIICSYILYIAFKRSASVRNRLSVILPLFLTAAGSVIIIQSFVFLTDPLKDRPQTPYGILGACTRLIDIFTTSRSVIWQGLEQTGAGPILHDPGEGLAYIGFVGLLALTTRILILLWKRIKRDKSYYRGPELLPSPFTFIAIVSLVVATGVPFIWGLETLPEKLPLVRQFRALGRFSWAFYYIAAIDSALILNYYFQTLLSNRKKAFAYGLVVVASIIWLVEVNGYIIPLHNEGMKWTEYHRDFYPEGEESWQQFLKEKGYKPEDFQGILMLPFFHIGTEKLWTGQDYDSYSWQMSLGGRAALQLHLPIMDAMMSRSSWSQALKLIKTAAGPYSDKPALTLLKDSRPLLLLHLKQAILYPDQAYLLKFSDSIGYENGSIVYSFWPSRLKSYEQGQMASLKTIAQKLQGRDSCIECNGPWFVQHKRGAPRRVFFGDNVWPGNYKKDTTIAFVPIELSQDSILYECSVWTLTPKNNYGTPDFRIQVLDSMGKLIYEKDMPTKWAYDGEGSRYRASAWLRLPKTCKSLDIRIHKEEDAPTSFDLDELQVRPASGIIISKDGSGRDLINNHYLKGR